MIIADRSFPHPVLAPFRDDVTPNKIALELTVTLDSDNYYVDATLDYDNATLAALTANGQATHAFHFECKRNFYRRVFSSGERSVRVVLPTREVVGRIECSAFVHATTEIAAYSVAGSHADYGDATFAISTGDILALAETKVFDVYADYDPLKNLASILDIVKSDSLRDGPVSVNSDGDRLIATLSQHDYDKYTELKADPQLGALLANQVIVPVLMQAVYEIRETSTDEREVELSKRWYRSIDRKLSELQLDVRPGGAVTPLTAVQALLSLPLRRSLTALIHLDPSVGGEG